MAHSAHLLPTEAPFEPRQLDALDRLLASTSEQQRQWLAGFLAGSTARGQPPAPSRPAGKAHPPRGAEIIRVDFSGLADPCWSQERPFTAEVLRRQPAAGAQAVHVALSLAGSGIIYQPGDALVLVPRNDPAVVRSLLVAVGLTGDDALAARLTREFDVTGLTRPVMEAWSNLRDQPQLAQLLEGNGWQRFAIDRQLLDLVEAFPVELTAQELLAILPPLRPSHHPIASSPLAHAEEAHLLLDSRDPVAATLRPGTQVQLYLRPNRPFQPPQDGALPVVMIGPGLGVAPFRAFLQHRHATGASGRAWLIYGGERGTGADLSYLHELQELATAGVLTKNDLAFTRAQPTRRQLQLRLWERRSDLWAWLQEGAHLYLCGETAVLGGELDAALVAIARDQGGLAAEEAEAWLADLVQHGRLRRALPPAT